MCLRKEEADLRVESGVCRALLARMDMRIEPPLQRGWSALPAGRHPAPGAPQGSALRPPRGRGRAEDLEGELLPEAKWMCKGRDLPIDEWIRLGRCRHSWRLPLSSGPTRWRPPLRYQWAEPDAPWEALTWVDMRARCQEEDQLKGSPVIRRFEGSAEDFRKHWQQASPQGVESEI